MVKINFQKHLWLFYIVSLMSLLPLCLAWFSMVTDHPKTFIGLYYAEKREFYVNQENAVLFLLCNAISILLSALFFRMTRKKTFLTVLSAQFVSIAVFILFLIGGYAIMI